MAEAKTSPQLEAIRAQVGRSLPSSCADDFQRLSRTLVYGPAFQWLLVDAPQEGLRKQVMAALEQVLKAAGMHSNRLPLSDKITDVATLEQRLLKNADQAQVVHLVGRPGWFTPERWDAFNVRRERLAAQSNARLVFWLDAEAIELASRGAPDLWAWRGGVYRFESETVVPKAITEPSVVHEDTSPPASDAFAQGIDNRTREERLQRIAEIRTWAAAHQELKLPDEMLAGPFDELGHLLYSLHDYEAALEHWRTVELPLYERLGNERSKAITVGQIADVLRVTGKLDEALRIRQEEQLPVYERLGDERNKAVTLGKIADVLTLRGQLDEALRILQDEVRPTLERLGDVRGKAVTLGRIADILQLSGQIDEALRIRQEEQLPVYEHLGDARAKAVTKGKIASNLLQRGQLDEALHVLQDEVLPALAQQDNVRDKAVTLGRIADILQLRGQLDEALRIRKEEELPVYERIQDRRELLIGQTKLAVLYLQKGDESDRPHIESLLLNAHQAAKEMHLPEAGRIANIYSEAFGKVLPP